MSFLKVSFEGFIDYSLWICCSKVRRQTLFGTPCIISLNNNILPRQLFILSRRRFSMILCESGSLNINQSLVNYYPFISLILLLSLYLRLLFSLLLFLVLEASGSNGSNNKKWYFLDKLDKLWCTPPKTTTF